MSELIRAFVLGVVQGLTEFVPVSSSGHLVLAPWALGWPASSLLFDAILHWGTLVAILLVFWRDFWMIIKATLSSLLSRSLADANARLGWYIVLGSIPAALVGLFFKEYFESLFQDPNGPRSAGLALLITAALLAGSEWIAGRRSQLRRLDSLRWLDGLLIGLAQAFALFPGISRSGSTIAAGLALGIQREDAARFSFFLGAPAFLGAGLLQLSTALSTDSQLVRAEAPALLVGFVTSAVVGFLAIRLLLAYLHTRTLYLFSAYCAVVGLVVLLLTTG
ncbi:MAG: undecaprenyl-diphosphatase UppP [Caldilineaceae bacterium]|nr:undecaprenyl-diphosphatase UppP [Caldilineaceae bacterium]